MDKIIELLAEKNLYLEKFLEESKAEKRNFKVRKFETLNDLFFKRERILENIESIDNRIQKICEKNKKDNLEESSKKEMGFLLDKIRKNVHFIMEEDLGIISCIEKEKSKIIKQISKTSEGRRALKGYKSK